MYTYEDRIRAVELYIKLGGSTLFPRTVELRWWTSHGIQDTPGPR